MVDESMVKSASQGISAGCGIRVVSGERTGYAYTDDLSAERILHAARTAALIASGPAKTPTVGFQQKAARSLYPVTLPSVDAEITAKVELVMRADSAARSYDARIKEVRASYADELRHILIVTSDGTFAEDSQPLARMNVSCIAKAEPLSGRGSSGGGGRVAAWRPTSIARRRPRLPAWLDAAWPARSARSWTTARCPGAAAR